MAATNGTATTLRVGAESSALVGNTPLVALPRLGDGLPGEVVAKLEYFNPGGSVKDRIGVAMIDAAERDGLIEPRPLGDRRAHERQHGDRARLGLRGARLRAVLTLPEGMSRERTALLRTYGAEVHETPSLGGMNEAVELAERIVAEQRRLHPAAVLEPGQPRDPPADDRRGDLARPRREVDAFVSGVGTGGTITGVGQVLRSAAPRCSRRRSSRPARGALGRPARPTQDPGDRRGLRARGAGPRGDRRGRSPSTDEDALETARASRRSARGCWSASPPVRRSRPRSTSRRARR